MTMKSTSALGLSMAAVLFATATAAPAQDAAQAATDAAAAAAEAAAVMADAVTTGGTDGALASCGESGLVWLGENPEGSDLIGREAAWSDKVIGTAPQGRAFRLSEPAMVRLEAATHNGGDPTLSLLDAEGTTVAENDDSNGSYNSQIEQSLPAGDYCVVAKDLRNALDVELQIGLNSHNSLFAVAPLVCGPETEATTLTSAEVAGLAQGPWRNGFDALENSYIKFTLEKPMSLSLRAAASGEVDPTLTLFDASGYQMAFNDNATGRDAQLDFMPTLAAGSYCLGVSAVTRVAGKVDVSVQTIDIESYKREASDRGEMIPSQPDYPVQELVFNRPHGELVLQGQVANWFQFELTEASLVGVNTLGTPSGADTMLTLYSGAGHQLLQIDDIEDNRNAMIEPRLLQPGRYFLALTDRSSLRDFGAPLRPVVVLAERFIRAPAQ